MTATAIATPKESTLMPLLGVPDSVLDALRSLDITGLSSTDVRAAISELRVWHGIGAALDARLRDHAAHLTALADADRDGHGADDTTDGLLSGCGDPGVTPETLDADAGLSPAEGRRRQRRARFLAQFTAVAAALTDGRCTTDHVDVIANEWANADPAVAARLPDHDPDLAMAAGNRPPTLLRRYVQHLITRIAAELGVERAAKTRDRRSVRHWYAAADGMGRLIADLDPDTYNKLADILDRETGRRLLADPTLTHAQAAADALTALICGDITADSTTSAAVGVLVDLATLTGGLHPGSICERPDGTPIDLATIRAAASDHGIVPIVLAGPSLPLDVGRARRLATVAQRTALTAIHTTCAIPDCDTPITRTEIHHIEHWEHGGTTDLANLIPLCT
ncbi:MAG: HNH endonuclease, partial [Ilumatobacteraceae bacterium]